MPWCVVGAWFFISRTCYSRALWQILPFPFHYCLAGEHRSNAECHVTSILVHILDPTVFCPLSHTSSDLKLSFSLSRVYSLCVHTQWLSRVYCCVSTPSGWRHV